MLVLYGERRARGANRASNERPRIKALYHLRGFKAFAAMSWCVLVFACAFVIPVLQLVVWFWQRGRFDLDERYAGLILHTLYLGGMAALITVSVALLLAFARRLAPTGDRSGVIGPIRLRPAGIGVAVSISLPQFWIRTVIRLRLAGWCGKPLSELAALLMAYLVRLRRRYGVESIWRVTPSLRKRQ